MKGALSLRIEDGRSDQHVTRHTTGLTFSKTAPGGHEALSARINQPRSAFPNLGPADRAYVYDTRTGRCLLDAYTANPTPVDGRTGQAFDIAAVGGKTRAADETRPLLYASGDLGLYEQDPQAASSSGFSTGAADPSGETSPFPKTPRVRVQINPGDPVGTEQFAGAGNYALERARTTLAALTVTVLSGKTDGGYRTTFASPAGTVDVGNLTAISNAAATSTLWAGTDYPTGIDRFSLRLRRILAATNVADDLTWSDFYAPKIIGARLDRYGQPITGAAGYGSATTVRADQVVEDLLGRLLTGCDPGAAVVTRTQTNIDQLAWLDGATAQRVLDELSLWEPDMLWEILESTAAGHRFAYRPWPTEPRYEISVRLDSYRETGSDDDLCNRISVTWTDAAGKMQTTVVTATSAQYPALYDLERTGRTHDADQIALEDGFGSEANAVRIGTQKLAAINTAATAATAVLTRRVYDHLNGGMVDPWEIDPGYPVLVREPGAVLRLTRMEYVDDNVATTLTLGQPVLTDEQRIARLERVA